MKRTYQPHNRRRKRVHGFMERMSTKNGRQGAGSPPQEGASSSYRLMRRYASLRRQTDFARLRRHGSRISSKHLTIYRSDPLPTDSQAVLGISVAKAVGSAVVRNRVRRRVGAIVHEALAQYRPGRLLVIPRPSAAQAEYHELRAELLAGLERL